MLECKTVLESRCARRRAQCSIELFLPYPESASRPHNKKSLGLARKRWTLP
jgi:hypothetical protein